MEDYKLLMAENAELKIKEEKTLRLEAEKMLEEAQRLRSQEEEKREKLLGEYMTLVDKNAKLNEDLLS